MKKVETPKKENVNMFLLEENIIRAYALVQHQMYNFVINSKFSLGEIAKELKIDRGTFTKKFKEQKWSAKELYDLTNLLNKKLIDNLHNKEKELELKKV